MIAEPKIVETSPVHAAVIRITIPRREMMAAFGPAVGELMAALAAQGVAPSGPVFAHHLTTSADMFDFELGVPVGAPVVSSGRIQAGLLPAARVARTVYTGPYEGLHAAWGEFGAWILARGYEPAQDLWEVYATGPQSGPDPSSWRTELNRPLKTP
jgi:effector-binding domain-containing protein